MRVLKVLVQREIPQLVILLLSFFLRIGFVLFSANLKF